MLMISGQLTSMIRVNIFKTRLSSETLTNNEISITIKKEGTDVLKASAFCLEENRISVNLENKTVNVLT